MGQEVALPVRLAILGAGAMGTVHGLASRDTPEAKVRAVWSRSRARARALAIRLGARVEEDVATAVSAPDVDAVLIATPTHLHAEAALAALAAGKHVLCEKPLARDLAAAESMCAAAERANRLLLVGHVVRFFPEFVRLREAVLTGEVGEAAVVRMARVASYPRSADDWRDHPEYSGGVVLDMGYHDLDWLLWTFGPAEEVYARGLYAQPRPLLDYALLTVRMACGVIAHVESSWAEREGFRVYGEVAGDGGLLTYDSAESTPYSEEIRDAMEEAPGVRVPSACTVRSPYALQLAHWARVLAGREPPITPPADALAALRLGLAALEAMHSGQPVRL